MKMLLTVFLLLTTLIHAQPAGKIKAADDRDAIEALLSARGAPSLGWDRNGETESNARLKEWMAQPMTMDVAVRAAMLRSARLQQIYGDLKVARADVLDAVQIANPRIQLSRLGLQGGPGGQFVSAIAEPVVDLLTFSIKARLARKESDRARDEVAAAVFGVSLDVQAAWFQYAGAQQVGDMRAIVAEGAQTSADLAQRFYDAGNITELQLNREKAIASQARIDEARAGIAKRMARLDLITVIGLAAGEGEWDTPAALPLPLAKEDDPSALQALSEANNLSLLAARKSEEIAAIIARVTRKYRLLGVTALGFDREREVDRSVIQGPTLDIELPIFNRGKARVTRAEGRLLQARGRLNLITLSLSNSIATGSERVRALSAVVNTYRAALVPEREMVTKQSQLEQNFALIGEFEVLQARVQQAEAYQGYLQAIRDYWLARVDLSRLVGSRLPTDSEPRLSDKPPVPTVTPGHEHHHPQTEGERE
jgi:cobalt-zinc-cadmium efflux system outer membrane protein